MQGMIEERIRDVRGRDPLQGKFGRIALGFWAGRKLTWQS
jgi:hypothetical protein